IVTVLGEKTNPPAPAWIVAVVAPPAPPPESSVWVAVGEGGGGWVVPLPDGVDPDEHAEATTDNTSTAARPNLFIPTPPRIPTHSTPAGVATRPPLEYGELPTSRPAGGARSSTPGSGTCRRELGRSPRHRPCTPPVPRRAGTPPSRC